MLIKRAIEGSTAHVITVRQPFASLIAWGLKHYEFRSRPCNYRGAVVIHAGAEWYAASLRSLVREHFMRCLDETRVYFEKSKEGVSALTSSSASRWAQALFPVRLPVAACVVTDCKSHGHGFAIKLDRVRLLTHPKPPLDGSITVPWRTPITGRLAEALDNAVMPEQLANDKLYGAYGLLKLRDSINAWLCDNGQADKVME